MFRVTITNDEIDTVIHNKIQKLKGATITQAINVIDSFSFNILPNMAGYDNLYQLKTKIKVFNNPKNRTEFLGRILKPIPVMDSTGLVYKNVICESVLGYLCDSIQPFVEMEEYTVEEFLNLLLTNHNLMVEDEKKIFPGTVELTDTIYRNLNYQTTWQAIQEKLLTDDLDGELRIREGEDGLLYLDLLNEIGATTSTTIELAKNMQSMSNEPDISSIVTRLIPLGAKAEGAENRLTIEAVNDGKIYIDVPDLFDIYGIICKTVMWDDVTIDANLKTKAQNWLIDNNRIKEKTLLTALDLSYIGKEINDFAVGNRYIIKNSLLNFSDTRRITRKTISLSNVYKSTIELGDALTLQSDYEIRNKRNIDNTEQNISIIQTNIENIENRIDEVNNEMTEQYTTIMQNNEEILFTALQNYLRTSDFESFQEELSTQLSISADEVQISFSTLQTAISSLGGDVNSQFSELHQYIRFVSGKIILGEINSPYSCRISNIAMEFIDNNVVVSYFSNGKMFIKKGEIIETLTFNEKWEIGIDSVGGLYIKWVGGE
jgi:phage minor structural protein